jgi:phosphoglycolate phosphatase
MKAYFFDLDGTLTDARPGLHVSFRAAVDSIGADALSDAELDRFLGAPLPEMCRVLKPDISKAGIARAIDAFRKTYEAEGIALNRRYPGVTAMLEAIARRGAAVWVVTSKPEHYARNVVGDLKIDKYLGGVVGAGLEETDTKAELIARALAGAKVARDQVLMVGDRFYDIEGALQNKVTPVGALWGYGSYEELHSAGCRHFASSPADFQAQYVEKDFVPVAPAAVRAGSSH